MQLPAWMLAVGAADVPIVESPRLPLAALADLRRLIGDGLPSASPPTVRGDEDGGHSDTPARPVSAAGPTTEF